MSETHSKLYFFVGLLGQILCTMYNMQVIFWSTCITGQPVLKGHSTIPIGDLLIQVSLHVTRKILSGLSK